MAGLFGAIEIGPWTAWRDVGVPDPDPYTRAYIARTGALQLGASEGLQFVATSDSDNRRLDRDCRYRIDGTHAARHVLDAGRRSSREPARRSPAPMVRRTSTAPGSRRAATARSSSTSADSAGAAQLARDHRRRRRSTWCSRSTTPPASPASAPTPPPCPRSSARPAHDPHRCSGCFAGVVLGGIIHIAVILGLPALSTDGRVGPSRGARRTRQANRPARRQAGRAQPAAPRSRTRLCRLPDRPAEGPGRRQPAPCPRPSGRSPSTAAAARWSTRPPTATASARSSISASSTRRRRGCSPNRSSTSPRAC